MHADPPYYAKAEKKPKRGYLNTITDKITGATTPAQHKTEGISYFKKGMTEEALEELKLASEGIKEDGELRHYLGKSYYENDRYDEAITELLAAVSIIRQTRPKKRPMFTTTSAYLQKEKCLHGSSLRI